MLGQLIDWLMSQAAKRPSARSSEAPSQKKKKKAGEYRMSTDETKEVAAKSKDKVEEDNV